MILLFRYDSRNNISLKKVTRVYCSVEYKSVETETKSAVDC